MKYSLVIGRFQPLHNGHKELIQRLIDEGKHVAVGLMDTGKDEKNPLSVFDRMAMLHREFGDKIRIVVLPPINAVCYGRNVGYHIRPIYLERENISASSIRSGQPMMGFTPDVEWLESYRRVAEQIHQTSTNHGLWPDGDDTDISYKIAHLQSEVSEAWECARTDAEDKNITGMKGLEVQLADVLGILMDMEVAYGLHISEALLRKMEFNKGRPYLHGKQF